MINHLLVNSALKARGLGLSVVTTGPTSLGSNAQGYTRTQGSFLADGFTVGMEVTPSFGSQTPSYITALTDTLMTMHGGRAVMSAGQGRSLRVVLPAMRAFDNENITPVQGRWYVEGEYSPSTSRLRTITASRGSGDDTGEYFWRLYGIADTGLDAFSAMTSALLALYPPGAVLPIDETTAVHIGTLPAPWASSVQQDDPGFAVCTVTIPWFVLFTNPAF